jgi:hypothetical protein
LRGEHQLTQLLLDVNADTMSDGLDEDHEREERSYKAASQSNNTAQTLNEFYFIALNVQISWKTQQ